MTKTQRLRNVADGLMAGLVECGYRGPWKWAHHEWEGSFYRVWRDWPPARRSPNEFPAFEVGGHGHTSQAREIMWELKSTSPFHRHDEVELTRTPRGLSPRDFLDISINGATPDEWVALANSFLGEMKVYED